MKKTYLKCLSILLLCLITISAFAQKSITGTVKDASGPLPGVSVSIKGTTKVTQTDGNGKFSLTANSGEILVFTAIGYARQEISVNGQTTINVTLTESANQLNEVNVVTTALGIKRQEKSLGYAVSTVTAKQLTEAGNTNFASALYGKAAGVKITTAPGGASSAVNVQIRGINSINYNQQPLYVVDGVMIRNDGQNGAAGANNNNYWDDQRVRGNGILDINPADIESLTVLKGASASALYGSDAASGVVVITTKKGSKNRGLGVDFNYQGSIDQVAFLPRFQNTYGPGYDRETNVANGATEEGWIPDAASPSGFRPYFRAYANFGPKMEGQQVRWWDGSIRSYSPQPDNYRDVYQNGYTSNANIAISNQTEGVNYRFSASRLDYKGTQPGNTGSKNTFNLNSTIKLAPKLSADVIVSYVNTITKNRPYQLGQVLGSFGGFFSRAEDMGLMKEKFQTSNGYKYATFDQVNRPEPFIFNIRATNLLDFYWQQLKNQYDENENRLLSSFTLNYDVAKNLKLRGRIGNDYTSAKTENRQFTEIPSALNTNTSTGSYTTTQGQYAVLYGDALLTYSNKIGEDFGISVSGGYQGRKETYKDLKSNTKDGLVTENFFALANSFNVQETTEARKELLKYAYLGLVNLSYKDFLFAEGTARQEYVSSLPPGNNQYSYYSVNSGFVFSDLWKLPKFWSYGKLRASYGVVGNAPPIYEANISYKQISLQTINGSVPSIVSLSSYGNLGLMPEKKHEAEFGLETRFLNGRLGLDVSYYNNKIKNQILPLDVTSTNGAQKQIVNVGEVGNKGWEIALNATPVSGKFRWDTRLNFSTNKSKVNSLYDANSEINFYSSDQATAKIVARAGEDLGNIYIRPRKTDANGNYLINDDGYYVMDNSTYVKAGNIMPKAIGGFSNTFSYGNLALDFTIDYRFGGKMIAPNLKYMRGAGMLENSMEFRDAANGGLTYTSNGKTYNDGVVLKGVNQTTGLPNTKVLSAADYYLTTYNWGEGSLTEGEIFDNNYIKMREIVLSYKIPPSFTKKLKISNVRFSLIGRNLFYIHRTLKDLDPEAPLGNKWWSQGVDVGSTAASRNFGFSLNANF
ncbi:SusC/RagA family TonB-linked outer membrane protein [Pedobacter zeae]|uniref:Iron complex outermembrane receptor protein n=1 Tax=Pedobacter zeae TaxID=1737356 RepID=A0A7W6KF27_9SPHI|nr:SusC/RagA family TonB-linked outer membrane protein [Pedobacter zeae]MBB4110519.1 iron complex outermembrane receptor protein [Pedobacter zeae]GGH18346.1 SusC/RagA family TonB-linked outer membrane protein [Pedobacter zeae]